ncbi:MAG TPA: cysteine synthase A [Gammaproteobacteria bacterium]|nr:cysteine synthase A [Gammaproteobacteria bacterium]
MRYEHILDTIGRTPVVRINRLAPAGRNVFAKIEAFNPMGSVKDRLALGIIEDAERSGALTPRQTVVEATSGNTGIGLAMVCARKGYPLVVTMAEHFSVERRRLMRFLGARVVLTPASEKGSGMLAKAVELAETHGWFLCRQFENEANADIHSATTAVEILEDFADIGLDYFVTGFGTGGTLKGVSRVLREQSPKTRIVVCEPDNSALLASGIAQDRDSRGAPAGSHPRFRPHLMQGWSPDFIPRLAEDAVDAGLFDQIVTVAGADALRLSRELAQKEGIFVGISSGATLAAAIEVAAEAPANANILCMLSDTGERYLSTQLFADIPSDMTTEEIELSRSTPRFRFDVSAPKQDAPKQDAPKPKAEAPKPEVTAKAADFLARTRIDAAKPVVMFALEWCEFCWSVRRMFQAYGIPCYSVDLDSVEYQQGDWGGQIRSALTAETGMATIPQIFVGGEFVGGCTDAFDAWRGGRLQRLLDEANVGYSPENTADPYSFLPTWLHPR